jgi:hypothetical protein
MELSNSNISFTCSWVSRADKPSKTALASASSGVLYKRFAGSKENLTLAISGDRTGHLSYCNSFSMILQCSALSIPLEAGSNVPWLHSLPQRRCQLPPTVFLFRRAAGASPHLCRGDMPRGKQQSLNSFLPFLVYHILGRDWCTLLEFVGLTLSTPFIDHSNHPYTPYHTQQIHSNIELDIAIVS